jgi:hypothetical protein
VASREDKAANKMGDIFADSRLNVVQLAYLTSLTWTPDMFNRFMGWLHWHNDLAEKVQLRSDGGIDYIDGEYLDYIKKANRHK